MERDVQAAKVAEARRWLAQRLEALYQAGVEQVGCVQWSGALGGAHPQAAAAELPQMPAAGARLAPRAAGEPLVEASAAASVPTSAAASGGPMHSASLVSLIGQPYPSDGPADGASRQRCLDELAEQVRACRRCAELVRNRTQTVFGVGQVCPQVVFFGEAPGADEDRQGEPFVGRAGQLLTKIIEACGWRREEVYIMNVLKCRPPDNRTPLPHEVEHCRPFFERQLEILRPPFIVCLGSVSSQALLETTESVGKLRGRLHRYRDSKVLVTYHPSYLLRNPAAKKYVWDDMQMLLREMGQPVPRRG
jgi:uracil-DNA glycosylase family 4